MTELHSLLAGRRSPRAFTPDPVPADHVRLLLEAARWAPSANNRQPWRFVVGPAGTATHERVARVLSEKNRRWAAAAPLLLLAIAKMTREEGKPARHAPYDLGQAVAHLTVQAEALGLAVHQMAGFDTERARAVFSIPDDFAPYVAIAVGRRGSPSSLPDDLRAREERERVRAPVEELVWEGSDGAG